MKLNKIGARAIVLLLVLTMVACKSGNVKQADPNYMQTINAHNQALLANAQMVTALASGCKTDTESDAGQWCTALVTSMVTGGGGGGLNTAKVPTYQKPTSKGDIILSKSLDILGRALPIFGNVIISKDNNKANVAIQESRNAMLGDIVTSGFNGMTTLGNRDTISVGGDYIDGDGNVTGDGNTVGDNNTNGDGNIEAGDGATIGNGNLVGDGNTTIDAGDGATIGDSNTVGDDNVDGDGNNIDNDIGGGLFNGDGNDDGDGDDNSPDPIPPN